MITWAISKGLYSRAPPWSRKRIVLFQVGIDRFFQAKLFPAGPAAATLAAPHGWARDSLGSGSSGAGLVIQGILGEGALPDLDGEPVPLEPGPDPAPDVGLGDPVVPPGVADGPGPGHFPRLLVDEQQLQLLGPEPAGRGDVVGGRGLPVEGLARLVIPRT
jgi:hypothetical protein